VFYGIFSTTRLYHAIEVGNVSHRAKGEHKYHAIQQRKNTINQHNHKLSSAFMEMIPSPRLGFHRGVFLANHLAITDNLTRTTKRENTYKSKLMQHQKWPS